VCVCVCMCVCVCVLLRMEPRALHMLGKCSTTKLHLQSLCAMLFKLVRKASLIGDTVVKTIRK
jgi:hypothetical protein